MTNTEIIKGIYMAYSQKDMHAVMGKFSDDIVWIEPGDNAEIPFSGTFVGKAEVQRMLHIEHHKLTITSFYPKLFLEGENRVAVFGSDSAIVNETQKSYQTDFVQLFTIENGLVTHVQVFMDTQAIAKAFVANDL